MMSATSQLTHFPSGEDEQEAALYRAMLGILMQSVNTDQLSVRVCIFFVYFYILVYLIGKEKY